MVGCYQLGLEGMGGIAGTQHKGGNGSGWCGLKECQLFNAGRGQLGQDKP